MLMLLSLRTALVATESGAEEVQGGRLGGWGQRRVSLSQLRSKEEEAAAACRTGGWRGLWGPYPRYHCGGEKRRGEERGESTTSVTAHGKHWNHLTTEVKTIFTETLQKE